MGRGKHITQDEANFILALAAQDDPVAKIAEAVRRSPSAVRKIIKQKGLAIPKGKRGRPSKLGPKVIRGLIRRALTGRYSARDLVNGYQLPVGVRRVQQILHNSAWLSWKKGVVGPPLTASQKENRVKFARKYMTRGGFSWGSVVFSDEKRFNLDGPDGRAYYWHDVRVEPRYFSKRQRGGGSVMVWGAMSRRGTVALVAVSKKMDSQLYTAILEEHLLGPADELYPNGYTFQQDGASPHTAKASSEWFFEHGVAVLDWPSKSPDLNVIENLWGDLVLEVYKNFKEYNNELELLGAVKKAWKNVTIERCEKLVDSMKNRCISVIEGKGKMTKY